MRTLSRWAARILHPCPVDECPVCGGDAAPHELRTLAQERFAAGKSGIEAFIEIDDFRAAAALDDRGVLGDLLTHELVRCGERVALITVQSALLLGERVRSIRILDGAAATAAWSAAS
jgi:hypothetical protein